MKKKLIRGGTVVTMNARHEVLQADVLVVQDRIIRIGGSIPTDGETELIEATGSFVMPGLVQGHVHLCQTLFRDLGDGLSLMDWLRNVVWPLEGAHDEETTYASARLGIAELLLSGTTAIIDMGTVNGTEGTAVAVKEMGIRAQIGKVLMTGGENLPANMTETVDQSLQRSCQLIEKWHNSAGERITYGFAPRGLICITPELLKELKQLVTHYRVNIHSHGPESREEFRPSDKVHKVTNIRAWHEAGLTGPHLQLAHCIWVDEEEMRILRDTRTNVVHCPAANLKLGSGIARVAEMLRSGINVGIGCDGTPCNDNLDGFREMRLACMLQRVLEGASAMSAEQALLMATKGGAMAIGKAEQIGSLEVGKKADIVILNTKSVGTAPYSQFRSAASTIVNCSNSRDVRHVLVDGNTLVKDGRLSQATEADIIDQSERAIQKLTARAGFTRSSLGSKAVVEEGRDR